MNEAKRKKDSKNKKENVQTFFTYVRVTFLIRRSDLSLAAPLRP